MSDLKVCRICLCKGVKVYNYDSFHLKQYYEEIMASKVKEKDGLPNYFCYECAAILYKFHKFKEKCWMGEKVLKELLWSGSITLSSLSQIDRQDKNLQSPIDIITVSKRVRTYIIKSKIQDIKIDEIPEIETYVIECDSDDSLDDKNQEEIRKEMINKQIESIEDGKTNFVNERSTDEKAIPDLEDDGEDEMFSDDEDSNSEKNINEVDKPAIKEEICDEIAVEEERINFNPEQEKSDDEIVHNKNHKEKKRKENQTETDVLKTKAKKFEVLSTKKNYLDPNHWLRINLTEEEALEVFKGRAKDQKYVSAAYKCSDCYKWFSKEDMLTRHIKLRHSESVGPVVCRFCKMRFKIKCHFMSHISQHYSKYKCLRCGLICLKNTAPLHNDYHNGVVRKCIHCGDEFRHLSTYYTHLRTHRSEHVCTLCGASFVSAKGLDKHKKSMHIDNVVNPEEGVTHTDTYCKQCDIKFETRRAYQEHVSHSAKHDEVVEDLACETLAPSIPRPGRKFRRKPRKAYPCTICNKNFSSLKAYTKHHTEEHKDEPLPTKEEEPRRICEICGLSLAPASMAGHLNNHTREILYPCDTCGRQFSSKLGMTKHQLTHTDEKPVACTLCDKRFKQSSSMKLHYRTYHLKEPYPKRNRKNKTDDLLKDSDNMILSNFYARK